jgi:hypothetical protein
VYLLLDSNITAGYYLPRSLNSKKAKDRIQTIFDSVRSGESDHFFYLPNFCVAEVFSVFMKHTFGTWNSHVKKKGTIDTRVYGSLVNQFESDIHNGAFIYHYELSRYHILGINLVAPVDHYFRFRRGRSRRVTPMGTFDHLIISMGIHLAHIHGRENVAILSADDRLTDILSKCLDGIPAATMRKLKLDKAEAVTGLKFEPETFPRYANLKTATKADLEDLFGAWPPPVGTLPKVYRWTK